MIRYCIVLLCVVHMSVAQKLDDSGYAVAMKLRPNVVRLRTETGRGYGFIVAIQRGQAYIVTSRELLMKSSSVEVLFYEQKEPVIAKVDSKFRYEDSNLSLIKADVKSTFRWEPRCFSDSVVSSMRVWPIGMKGDWYIPQGSLTGYIQELKEGGAMTIGVPYRMYESTGAPLITGRGWVGLITDAKSLDTRGMSVQAIRHIVKDVWGEPFELQPFDNKTPKVQHAGNCDLTLIYNGVGKDQSGNQISLNVYIKSLVINGAPIFIDPAKPYPIRLEKLPCGTLKYQLDAEVTNGFQVWRGKNEGDIISKEGQLFINWTINSEHTVNISINN